MSEGHLLYFKLSVYSPSVCTYGEGSKRLGTDGIEKIGLYIRVHCQKMNIKLVLKCIC